MQTIKRTSFILILMIAGLGACNRPGSTAEYKEQEGHPPSLNRVREEPYPADNRSLTEFIDYAASSSTMELQMADLALKSVESQEVKDLAQMIKNDHQRAADKLEELSRANGWKMPERMFDEHKQLIVKLNDPGDTGFTKQYLQLMVTTHQNAIDIFNTVAEYQPDPDQDAYTDEQSDGWNPELLEWVRNTLPVLKKHLEMSQELLDKLESQSTS